MPKTFTNVEREFIKKRLMEEAKLCLSQYGVQKTTVDELVKRVKIPKGTFYLFYESKYLLFFDVLTEFHNEIQAKLIAGVMQIKDDMNAKTLTNLFFRFYKMVEESFMLNFMTNGELELLIRKLPVEIALSHTQQDDFSVEQLIAMIPNVKVTNSKAISAAFRAIFLSMLHKHEIGEDVFDDALKIMLYGVVIQLFEGEVL